MFTRGESITQTCTRSGFNSANGRNFQFSFATTYRGDPVLQEMVENSMFLEIDDTSFDELNGLQGIGLPHFAGCFDFNSFILERGKNETFI